jgi:hypothetical protein
MLSFPYVGDTKSETPFWYFSKSTCGRTTHDLLPQGSYHSEDMGFGRQLKFRSATSSMPTWKLWQCGLAAPLRLSSVRLPLRKWISPLTNGRAYVRRSLPGKVLMQSRIFLVSHLIRLPMVISCTLYTQGSLNAHHHQLYSHYSFS